MSLKSSTKVDVNTQELVFTVDGAAFDAAIEKAYQRQKKNINVSERAKQAESLLKNITEKAFSLKRL